jgi:hypothetical protein
MTQGMTFAPRTNIDLGSGDKALQHESRIPLTFLC